MQIVIHLFLCNYCHFTLSFTPFNLINDDLFYLFCGCNFLIYKAAKRVKGKLIFFEVYLDGSIEFILFFGGLLHEQVLLYYIEKRSNKSF